MNTPDIINKTACLIFLLNVLWLLPRHESQSRAQNNVAQQHTNTQVVPESRTSEQKAKFASEPEQTSQRESSSADNVSEAEPEVELVSSSLPKLGDTADEELSHAAEAADMEKELQQTKSSAEKARSVDASAEWDWRVCPSAFGCPCPMKP